MVTASGAGVNESVITAPTEVGIVCNASPSMSYGGTAGWWAAVGCHPVASTGVMPAASP